MIKIEQLLIEIREKLRDIAPFFSKKEKERFYKILNSDNPNFATYGLKMPEIEKIARSIQQEHDMTMDDAIQLFKNLIQSNIHDEKFLGVFLLNRFKKAFTASIINVFYNSFINFCDTWALCDSSMIRVVGPFLGKSENKKLAMETVDKWSNSENMWMRRASLVILIKITMINKSFNEDLIFSMVEKMQTSSEDYIQKGIGWLLKTCSKYEPDVIFNYLMENKRVLSRLILRYASEKFPKEKRNKLLEKSMV